MREIIAGRFGLGSRRSGQPFGSGCARRVGLLGTTWSTLGRSGDTRVRVTGSHVHLAGRARSGRSGDTCVGWLAAGTSVLFGFARDVFATPCDGCFTLKRGSDFGGTICRSHSSYRALQQSRGLVCEDPFAKRKGSDTEFICRLQEVTSPEASQKASCGVERWCECGACERGWCWCCGCGCGEVQGCSCPPQQL